MDPRYGKDGKDLRLIPVGSLVDYNDNRPAVGPGLYGVANDDYSSQHFENHRSALELFPALVLEQGRYRTKVLTTLGEVTWLSNMACVQVIST